MGAAYSSLGRTKVLHATSLVLLGAKAKFLRRKPSCLSCFGRDFRDMLTPIHVISNGDTKVLLPTEHFPKFDCVVNN